jgi:hypothetical protein
MACRALPLVLISLLGACSPAQPSSEPTPRADADPPAATVARATAKSARPSAIASASAGGASKVESDDGVLEFSHSYPAAAGAIPALRALLDAERERVNRQARRDAAEDKAEAAKSGYPFHPHSVAVAWQVVADTPRFLSLSQSFYSFTGGAHGNYASDALVWDRETGRRIAAADLFASPKALRAAVLAPYCAGLDRERRRKGLEPPDDDPDAPGLFPRCPDPLEAATMLLGSSNGRRFDRLGFLIDPYVAGAFVEGDYEVTLPVTPAVLAAVKPEHLAAFAVR